jgi:hypothetical protein
MAACALPADVGSPWLRETVLKIDAGALTFGCPRLRREREYQCLRPVWGSAGGVRVVSAGEVGGRHASLMSAVRGVAHQHLLEVPVLDQRGSARSLPTSTRCSGRSPCWSAAPSLLAIPGAAELTAAKIVAETAGAERFSSKDAYARHNGTAPLPAWSANRTRHRLSRTGNRQLNCAIHRIAVTQARCHPQAQAYLHRRITAGDTKTEALRSLKRRLSDIVYRALLTDRHNSAHPAGSLT